MPIGSKKNLPGANHHQKYKILSAQLETELGTNCVY